MITAPVEVPVHLRQYTDTPQQKGNTMQSGGQKIKFVNPNTDNYDKNIRHAAELHKNGIRCYRERELIPLGHKKGPPVIVVGSGNTLKETETLKQIRHWVDRKGAKIFACKQALKFLHERGFKIDYGVTMDPGAHIARPEKIYKTPGTTHIVASSSDILLFDYFKAGMPYDKWFESLDEEKQKRILEKEWDAWKSGDLKLNPAGEDTAEIMIFHSATGYQNEVQLYNTLFETPAVMGGGYNVVNRALSAAIFMGASKIILAGCDCGWRKDEKFYVDGSQNRPGVDMSDHGLVEGTDSSGKPLPEKDPDAAEWMTRPDMLASGVALAKLIKQHPDRFVILGKTLPSVLIHKDEEFLNNCASFM